MAFPEAGKDFIDFLFNILSMPLGTVIRLLKEQGMVAWGVWQIYMKALKISMKITFNLIRIIKDIFLKPISPNSAANNTSIFLHDDTPKMGRTF